MPSPKKLPFLPLFVSDFLGDVNDLDAREIGAYMMLLMTLWQNKAAPLPLDHKRLARSARVQRGWPAVWEAISHHFEVDETGVWNKRLDAEWVKSAGISQVNAVSGSKGGLATAAKLGTGTQTRHYNGRDSEHSTDDNPLETNDPGAANATASQSSQPIERIEPNGSTSRSPSPRKRPNRSLPEDWVPDLDKARALMDEFGLNREDMNFLFQQMRGHAHGKDRKQADWDSAFANWVRKAVRDGEVGPNARVSGNPGSATGRFED